MWLCWDSNSQPLDQQSDALPTVLWIPTKLYGSRHGETCPLAYAASEGPDAQSDQSHRCPLTDSLDTTECMYGEKSLW